MRLTVFFTRLHAWSQALTLDFAFANKLLIPITESQEKIARQGSESKLLQALQQVSISATTSGGGSSSNITPGAGSPFTGPRPGWNKP